MVLFPFVYYDRLELVLVYYHFIILEPIGNSFQFKCKMFVNPETVFEEVDKVLSLEKLYTDALEIRRNK